MFLAFQGVHPQQEGLEGDRCQSERFPADEPEWREMTYLSLRILVLFDFLSRKRDLFKLEAAFV